MVGSARSRPVVLRIGPRCCHINSRRHCPLALSSDGPRASVCTVPVAVVAMRLSASQAPSRRPNTTPSSSELLARSEEHTSELQSLMRISYAVFCLKKTINILLYNTPSLSYNYFIHSDS